MASSKRLLAAANGMPLYFLPVAKHGVRFGHFRALTCVLWPFLVANVHLPFTRFPGFLAQSFKEPSLTHEERPMFP